MGYKRSAVPNACHTRRLNGTVRRMRQQKPRSRVTADEAQGRKRRLKVTVPHCNGGGSIYINNLFSNRTLSKTQYINQNNFLHFLYSTSIKTVFFFFLTGCYYVINLSHWQKTVFNNVLLCVV